MSGTEPDAPPTRLGRTDRRPRVVHAPGGHDYVRHATTPPAVVRTPPGADPAGRWAEQFTWPRAEAWLACHGDEVDVLHVHFGFDQVDPAALGSVLRAAARAEVAVVWTVHDLTNPHLVDQRPHEAQLALLAEHAVGLLTLTPGAAAEVEQRWGRRPVVVPHPHLAPLGVLARSRPAAGGAGACAGAAGAAVGPDAVVAVPLGMLRPATDPALVRALLHPLVADALPRGTVLRVTLREEVLSDGFPRSDPELVGLLRAADADGRAELLVGPRATDDALWQELATTSALVLPYRWGTHSGWVEACHDVGTPVVAPATGRWGEQQRVHAFAVGTDGPDPACLAAALADALVQGPRTEPVLAERLAQRTASVAEHARLHALAASGGSW